MEGRKNYTRMDIEKWAASLVELPQEIANLNTIIDADKAKLDDELQNLLQNDILPARLQLEKIVAKIELPELPGVIARLESKRDNLNDEKAQLQAELKELTAQISPIQDGINRIERLIETKKILTIMQEINRANEQLTDSLQSESSQLATLGNSVLSEKRIISEKESAVASLQARQRQLVISIESARHALHAHHLPVPIVSTMNEANAVTVAHVATSVSPAVTYGQVATIYPISRVSHSQNPLVDELRRVEKSIESLEEEISRHGNQCQQLERQIRIHQSSTDRLESELSQLRAKKTNFQRKINDLGTQSQAERSDMNDLQRNLSLQQQDLVPLNNKKNTVTKKQRVIDSDIASNELDIAKKMQRLGECEGLVKHFVPDSHASLERQRDDKEQMLANLKGDKYDRECVISQLKLKIRDDSTDRRNKMATLRDYQDNSFLRNLKNNPQVLLNKLITDIRIAIARFETENPTNQNYLVRLCLAELSYKLPFIQNMTLQGSDALSIDRDRYFLICGLVQDIYDRTSDHDKAFSKMLSTLLKSNDVSSKEISQEYQNLKQYFPKELSDLSLSDLQHREATIFRDEYDAFNVSLARINSSIPVLKKVKTLGRNLLDDLDERIINADEAHPVDYKYYASLLILGNQLLERPNDNALHAAFRSHLAHHADETPSVGNKIGGVGMLLLGAVITAGAVLVAVLGLPIAAPLYASIPVGAAGAGLMIGSAALLYRGCKKGLPVKADEFVNEVNKNKDQQMISQEKDKLLSGEASSYGLMDESVMLEPSAPGL